jgi:Cytochrome C oxidase, cbb3-type, subunit III
MENNRLLIIAAVLIAIGGIGIFQTTWCGGYQNPDDWASLMMGGGMMNRDMMRGMMNQMMPDLVPPGVSPENLPDPKSEGAQLLVYYCTQCHNLPSPSMHTAEEWPVIIDRMFRRISRMSGGMGMMMSVEMPSPDEQRTIVSYLVSHGMRSISPGTLPSPESKGAAFFKEFCSQCHALPDPKLHTSNEWAAVVEKMRGYMRAMDRKVITEGEAKEVLSYLGSHAMK